MAVLVLGETSTWSARATAAARSDLPGQQQALARAVVATGKPVVVVLVNGRPLAIPWLERACGRDPRGLGAR